MEEADQLLITTLGHLGLQLPEKKVFYSHLLKFFPLLTLQANIASFSPF